MRIIYATFIVAAALLFAWAAIAQQTEKRIALIIGNAAYQAETLPTAANDAGLIAQTLQAAGLMWWVLVTLIRIRCAGAFAISLKRQPAWGQIRSHSFILVDTVFSLKARTTLSQLMHGLPETRT